MNGYFFRAESFFNVANYMMYWQKNAEGPKKHMHPMEANRSTNNRMVKAF